MSAPTPILQLIVPVFQPHPRHFKEALESLNGQTLGDFEVILIDDGSSPPLETAFIAQHLKRPFRLIALSNNCGVAHALNTGLDAATAPLIARFDADDRLSPFRFERQLTYMQAHPEIGVCGTGAIRFGQRTDAIDIVSDHDAIAAAILTGTPFCHPTVMMRRNALGALRYPTGFAAEDTLFWAVLLQAGIRMANLPEALLQYRIEGQNISVVSRTERAKRFRITSAEVYRILFGSEDLEPFLEGLESGAHQQLGLLHAAVHHDRRALERHVSNIMDLVQSKPQFFPQPEAVARTLQHQAQIAASPLHARWHKVKRRMVMWFYARKQRHLFP